MTARFAAFELLHNWYKNKAYINKLLSATAYFDKLDKQDLSLCTNLCLGAVERKLELDYIISQLSNRSVDKIKLKILILLEMGIYQLKYMSGTKAYAVCNEMTGLAKKIGLSGLSGYVNAVLRNYLRRKDEIIYPDKDEDFIGFLSVQYSMPKWLCEHFAAEIGKENTSKAFEYFMNDKTVTARVVLSISSVSDIVKKFEKHGISYKQSEYLDYVFEIYNVSDLLKTDILKKGLIQIQGFSSILVGEIAKSFMGKTVLDICAAPGGKALHLADNMKAFAKENKDFENATVVARDIHSFGIDMLKKRALELNFKNIAAEVHDATVFNREDENKYDLIIADLPCSGLGVIGKKPDIKYYSSKEGIKSLADLQFRILENAIRYLKPKGYLIYSTCTVSELENIDISNRLVHELGMSTADISKALPEKISCNLNENWRIQLLPGEYKSDGFFISGFCKM